MIKLIDLLEQYGGSSYSVPDDHQAGLRVPRGGSCCANCKYWNDEEQTCGNEYYKKWAETDKIPYPPNEFCSDWWEPK